MAGLLRLKCARHLQGGSAWTRPIGSFFLSSTPYPHLPTFSNRLESFALESQMKIAHEKLVGLDREAIVGALGPVLAAHAVDCVELVWRSDRGERVLEVTVEKPGSVEPGAGVTLELVSEVSRDLSAALDVADCIAQRYRLEVGSPGLERTLYGASDFERFSGRSARLKLRVPVRGQHVLVGTLAGVDEATVGLEIKGEVVRIPLADVDGARLVFEWKKGEPRGGRNGRGSEHARDVRSRARNGAGE
jgi:ribosome maturation factor RimP